MTTGHPHVARLEFRAALLSLVVAAVLLTVKFTAYGLTRSTAIFSDALESIVNVVAAAVAVYSIRLAHRPADRDHPYGHGKAEFLSAGFEGGMILLAAAVMVFRAAEALVRGPGLERVGLGMILTAGTMFINAAVSALLIRTGRRHGSIALEADGKHLLSDAISSAVVLASLGVVQVSGWLWADPVGGLIVAAYVAYLGWGLLHRSAAGLMDKQDSADQTLLRRILDSHVGPTGRAPQMCSYHKLRHRHSGRYHWVDFHIMVPPSWDVRRGHEIASAIEYEIERALGEGNATAHVEPCTDSGCALCGVA